LKKYLETQNALVSKVRDIPNTAGSVIWVKQIQAKKQKYMERVKNVLGPNWHEQIEGKRCKQIGDDFEKHLKDAP
jgi:dynein heavy chain 1